jgi:hypothetical protein
MNLGAESENLGGMRHISPTVGLKELKGINPVPPTGAAQAMQPRSAALRRESSRWLLASKRSIPTSRTTPRQARAVATLALGCAYSVSPADGVRKRKAFVPTIATKKSLIEYGRGVTRSAP